MKPTLKFFLLLCLTLTFHLADVVYSQGWHNSFAHPSTGIAPSHVTQTQDGGYFISGFLLNPTGLKTAYFLARTDVNGDTLWTKTYFRNTGMLDYEGLQTPDGGFAISGAQPTPNHDSIVTLRMDAAGDSVWASSSSFNSTSAWTRAIRNTQDGGIVLGGHLTTSSGLLRSTLSKVDSTGNLVWSHFYRMDTSNYTSSYNVEALPDGGFALMGNRSILGSSTSYFSLIRTDSVGDTLWTRSYVKPQLATSVAGVHAAATADGGFVFAHQTSLGNDVQKLDANGNLAWSKQDNSQMMIDEMYAAPDGGFFITGLRHNQGQVDGYAYVMRFDSLGDTLWTRIIRGGYQGNGRCGTPTSDGGFLLCGQRHPTGTQIPPEIFLIKFDSLGNFGRTWIMGNVYEEANGNCTQDPNESGLDRMLVIANPGPYYTLTDAQGNYEMNIDTGSYDIFAVPRSSYWNQSCPTPNGIHTVAVPQIMDTAIGIDFGHEVLINCPLMQVSLSTTLLRPCSTNVYSVIYSNQGTIDGDSAYVVIEVDSHLTVTGSSIPYRLPQSGNTYIFDLGDVAPGQNGGFTITTLLDCNAPLDLTHCVMAHIYPDSMCDPQAPQWDLSSIQVTGKCQTTQVEFKVRNIGTGNMASPGSYVILEDNIMRSTVNGWQLLAGDSLTITLPNNGSTWALIAEQVPNHPGRSQPRAFVEACGVDSMGNFSTGFITILAMDDENPFIDIDCRQNVRAWDPNDKQVFPNGTGASHAIFQQSQLEYLVRFQNTGNDTAFKVVIRDTISPDLDLRTLQLGASSHPFTFRIYGSGIAEWTFDGILLPDSNVNEPASHGFLRFSIDQTPGLAIGTRIENDASIYFDYNPPVITNIAFVTLEDSWGQVGIEPLAEFAPELKVFPNPFTETATFQVDGQRYGNLTLEIIDLNGKTMVHTQGANTNKLVLKRGELPAGMYIFRLKGEGNVVGTGRIVVY